VFGCAWAALGGTTTPSHHGCDHRRRPRRRGGCAGCARESLPLGIAQEREGAIVTGMSAATVRLVEKAPARSARLLADLQQFDGRGGDDRPSVFDRLAAALGQELAERIIRALSAEARDRLDAALTPAFAERLAAALAKEIEKAAHR
jgi:hypothetical protein